MALLRPHYKDRANSISPRKQTAIIDEAYDNSNKQSETIIVVVGNQTPSFYMEHKWIKESQEEKRVKESISAVQGNSNWFQIKPE